MSAGSLWPPISVVDVELAQENRIVVHLMVNLGELEHWVAGDPSEAFAAAFLLSTLALARVGSSGRPPVIQM